MNLHNKVVLITGGAGFIGSHVVDEVVRYKPEKIVVIDNFFLGTMDNLSEALREFGNIVIYREDAGDYTAVENVLESEGVDLVFDLAVKPLPYSFVNPEGAYMTSVQIAFALCSLLRKGTYETLIHFSSSEAYGSAVRLPMDESHPCNPTTPYAAGKLTADILITSYHKSFGLDVAIMRPFNTYGPRQNDKAYSAVIPTTIARIMNGKEPYIEGNGKQTRDFSFVKDVAKAAVQIYLHRNTRGKILNIGSGKETGIGSLIKATANLMGYHGEIERRRKRTADVYRHCADISLAKKLIGFEPKTELMHGLRETTQWYLRKANQGQITNSLLTARNVGVRRRDPMLHSR